MNVAQWKLLKASPEYMSQGPRATIAVIPGLEQLAALPQLTRVELHCGEFSPGKVLMQLPASCELVVHTSVTELSESLPHLVGLRVWIGVPHNIHATC